MENWKQTTIVGLVAIIAVLCVFQAGCSEPCAVCASCNCDEAVRAAVEAAQQNNPPSAVEDEVAKKQAEAGAQCLLREEASRKAEELEKKTEAEACDAHLVDDSECMDEVCPFDPQKASPFRTLTTEEKLAASYAHSLRYKYRKYYLNQALECAEGKQWSKYTRVDVHAKHNCLQKQYYKAHKDVVLYTKPLGMHFAAPDEEDYGYEPALRVVLDILRDVDRDQGASLSDFGVTLAQIVTAYQLRFKEALEFYEARVKACDDNKDTFRDRDGILLSQLCDLVTDFNLYAAYPDPLKGVTRTQMAERLKCEEE